MRTRITLGVVAEVRDQRARPRVRVHPEELLGSSPGSIAAIIILASGGSITKTLPSGSTARPVGHRPSTPCAASPKSETGVRCPLTGSTRRSAPRNSAPPPSIQHQDRTARLHNDPGRGASGRPLGGIFEIGEHGALATREVHSEEPAFGSFHFAFIRDQGGSARLQRKRDRCATKGP